MVLQNGMGLAGWHANYNRGKEVIVKVKLKQN